MSPNLQVLPYKYQYLNSRVLDSSRLQASGHIERLAHDLLLVLSRRQRLSCSAGRTIQLPAEFTINQYLSRGGLQ